MPASPTRAVRLSASPTPAVCRPARRQPCADHQDASQPDACRTCWNREFTASERAGSGVSWRSGWSGAPGSWCWWCRRVLSPVSWDVPLGRRPLA